MGQAPPARQPRLPRSPPTCLDLGTPPAYVWTLCLDVMSGPATGLGPSVCAFASAPPPAPHRFRPIKIGFLLGKILTMVQPDTALLLRCSAPFHRGPRARAAGWFPRSGKGYRNSWCRECLRPLRAANAARRREAGVRAVSSGLVARLLQRQLGMCGCGCGRSLAYGFHVDHWNPIANGGKHEESNLRLLTPRCNLSKGKRVPAGVAVVRLSRYAPHRK